MVIITDIIFNLKHDYICVYGKGIVARLLIFRPLLIPTPKTNTQLLKMLEIFSNCKVNLFPLFCKIDTKKSP